MSSGKMPAASSRARCIGTCSYAFVTVARNLSSCSAASFSRGIVSSSRWK